MKQYLSFSECRLWYQNKDEYVRRYVLGQEQEPTKEQTLGKIVHAALEEPKYQWLKEMKQKGYSRKLQANVRTVLNKMNATLPPEREVVVTAKTKYGLNLLAVFDGLDRRQRRLYDYKTYSGKHEAFNQWIVDDHMQFSFYAWIWRLTYHQYFSDIEIDAINLDKATIKRYHTVRSSRDVEQVEAWANQAVREMRKEKVWDKRLSRAERNKLTNLKLL